MEPPSIRKVFCNTCKIKTNHELKAFHERLFADLDLALGVAVDEAEEYEKWKYYLWVCRGCDIATLEENYTTHLLEPMGQYRPSFYPKREKDSLPFQNFSQLNRKLDTIYREVITSFNNDARILCAIGLRALLEGICAEKSLQGRNLHDKIDGLKEVHLPSNIVESLHRFRFIGNEAAH